MDGVFDPRRGFLSLSASSPVWRAALEPNRHPYPLGTIIKPSMHWRIRKASVRRLNELKRLRSYYTEPMRLSPPKEPSNDRNERPVS